MENESDERADSIEVLYEDTDVVVINKPAHLIVHYDGRNEEPSVADWIIKEYPETIDVGEEWGSPQGEIVPRPGIVHRLDKTTSGVMVIARTQEAHTFLKQAFQERVVEKEYHTFIYGHPKEDFGTVEAEIGRTKKKPRRWTAQFGRRGNLRAAITDWRIEKRSEDAENGESASYLVAFPKTGRTHQIRVHLKAIHHPIVCDHLYAPKKKCILGFSRPALHARSLNLKLPNKEQKTFVAPFPEDFISARKDFGMIDEEEES